MTAHGRVRGRGRQALAPSRGRKPVEDVRKTQFDSFYKGDVSWFSDLFGKGILAADGDNRNVSTKDMCPRADVHSNAERPARRRGSFVIPPSQDHSHSIAMGLSLSCQNVALVAQAHPVAAIDPQYCDPRRCVTLRHELRTFKTGSTFVDAHTGHTRFQITTKLLSGRLTLLDVTNKAPIATFKQKFAIFSSPAFKVHAGTGSDVPELFQIHAEFRRGNRTRVRVEFTNMWTRERCELGFEGNWCHRDGFFWLDRGLKGVREPVAKLTHLKGFASHTVQVDIAPNMDTSLIAMVCTTLSTQEWEADDRLRRASSAAPPS